MTYSLNVEAADKAAAIAAATGEIDALAATGELPGIARDAIVAAVEAHVALLPDPGAGEVVGVGVNGGASDYGAGFVAVQTGVSVIVKPA